jgi:hypothetical protein
MKTLIASALLLAAAQGWSQNLLKNPSFEAGNQKPWLVHSQLPSEIFIENGELTVLINQASDTQSARMLLQKDLPLESNTKYILRFDAKSTASNGGQMKVTIVPSIDFKAGHYGLMKDEPLKADWASHAIQFRTKEISPSDPACLKIHLGGLNGNTSFRNFFLEKADQQ